MTVSHSSKVEECDPRGQKITAQWVIWSDGVRFKVGWGRGKREKGLKKT